MTWTTPQPHQPALLPPGPFTLGDIVGGAWRVYKARFGLFLKLLLMPFLIMFAATIVFGGVLIAMVAADPRGVDQATPAMIVLFVAFYLAMMVISLLVYVYQGRTMIAGIDLATGRENPTSANLADRTRGMLGRVVILMLLAFALGIVLVIALVAIMLPVAVSEGGGGGRGGGAVFAFLFMVVFYAAAFWLGVKLTYVIPAMAEERLDAIPAIKRSFQLTGGAFWRTFGYQLVLGLIGMAIFLVPYLIAIGILVATAFARDDAALVGAFVGVGFALLIMYVALLLYVPYQYVYTALMYLGRGREVAGATAGYPYPPQDPQANPWDAPPAGPSTQG